MTINASGNDALEKLLNQNITELTQTDPAHELLKFAEPVQNKRPFSDDEWAEFVSRFARHPGLTISQSEINYLIALEEVLGKR